MIRAVNFFNDVRPLDLTSFGLWHVHRMKSDSEAQGREGNRKISGLSINESIAENRPLPYGVDFLDVCVFAIFSLYRTAFRTSAKVLTAFEATTQSDNSQAAQGERGNV